MAKIRLIPSTYYLSNSNYLSVSDASNMYSNTDSTTYATVTNHRTSTNSYYIYVRGFNFDDIPTGATINSFTVKIRCNYSNGYSQAMYLYNGTNTSYGSSDAISGTVTTHSFTCNHSIEDVIACGADFGIRINCRRSARNTTSYIYIYGAEIEIDYTIPVYHDITVTGDSTKVFPTGTESVLEGTDYEVTMYYDAKPTVTDNGVDVTSQVSQVSSVTATLIPESYTNDGFTLSNIENAYTDAESTSRATLTAAAGGTKRNIYFNIEDLSIPSSATILSVTAQATLEFSRNGSSSGVTASCQMYANTTAKGSATTIVSSATDVAKTTYNLSIGSWTASEINSARFYITCTNNASGTARYVYVYGVSFNVTYESGGVIYIYSLTNITGDHAIVVTAPSTSTKLYFKQNGSWVEATTAYKKVSGVWVEQTDLTTVFQSGVNYVKGS